MKKIIKMTLLLGLSIFITGLMFKKGLVSTDIILEAFKQRWYIAVFMAFIVVFNVFLTALRYQSILKRLDLNFPLKNTVSSTFFGCSVGQWLPGSIAFIEVIRISILLGKKDVIAENVLLDEELSTLPPEKEHSTRSKLVAASILDRLVGFFVMLASGSVVCLYFVFTQAQNYEQSYVLKLLSVFYVFCTLVICALPLFASSKYAHRLLERSEAFLYKIIKITFVRNILRKIYVELESVIHSISLFGKDMKKFSQPLLISLVSFSMLVVSMFCAGLLVNETFPVLATIAIISIYSLAQSLPLSVGGIGIPQLVVAVCFVSMGVSAQSAASAGLLCTTLSLFAVPLISVVFLKSTVKRFFSMFKKQPVDVQ